VYPHSEGRAASDKCHKANVSIRLELSDRFTSREAKFLCRRCLETSVDEHYTQVDRKNMKRTQVRVGNLVRQFGAIGQYNRRSKDCKHAKGFD